jgi:hypothetical protein
MLRIALQAKVKLKRRENSKLRCTATTFPVQPPAENHFDRDERIKQRHLEREAVRRAENQP